MPAALPFFTIGHARHPLPKFLQLLQSADIQYLVDVRSYPRSRTNPQFNIDTLPEFLLSNNVQYTHMLSLGGRRPRQNQVNPQCNAWWQNSSFHNYADYAMQAEFADALEQLIQLGQKNRCAIMCSETLWWRCHRRIISDHLLAHGLQVFHILPAGIEAAVLTPGANIDQHGKLCYPKTNT